jgi:hypothetical protein
VKWPSILLLLGVVGWLVINWPQRGFWYDEALTAFVALDSWATLWAWCTQVDIQVPFHYVALRLWAGVAGDSEFALRALSAFSIVLAVAAVINIGKRLHGHGLGWAAGALLAFMPGLLWLAYEVRAYAWALALYAWATAFLVVILTRERPSQYGGAGWRALVPHRDVVGYVLLMLGALYTHYTALGAFAAHVAVLLLVIARRRSAALLRTGITIAILVGVGFAPWLPVMLARSAEDRSYFRGSIPPERSIPVMLGFQLMGRDDVPEARPALIAGVAVLLVMGIGWGALRKETRLAVLVGVLGILGPVAITAALVYFRPKLAGRYAWPAWIGVDLLLALVVIGMGRIRREFGVVALATLIALPMLSGERGHPPDSGFREAFAYLCQQGSPDDALLLRDGTLFVTAEYYLRRPPCGERRFILPMPMSLITDVDRVLRYDEAVTKMSALRDHLSQAAARTGKTPDVWVIAWQGEIMDPQGLTYALLDLNQRPVAGRMFGDVRLDQYQAPDQVFAPDLRNPIGMPVPDGPLIYEWRLFTPDRPTTGDQLVLHVWWRRGAVLAPDLRISAQLTSADGGWTYHQIDSPPSSWQYYDDRWLPGEPVVGRFELPINPDVPPGEVNVRFVLYDAQGRWQASLVPVARVRVW